MLFGDPNGTGLQIGSTVAVEDIDHADGEHDLLDLAQPDASDGFLDGFGLFAPAVEATVGHPQQFQADRLILSDGSGDLID
jgi:hypothetical protein